LPVSPPMLSGLRPLRRGDAIDRGKRAVHDLREESRNRVSGTVLGEGDQVVAALRPVRTVDGGAEAVSLGDAVCDLLDLAHRIRIDRGKGGTGRMPAYDPAPCQRIAVKIPRRTGKR